MVGSCEQLRELGVSERHVDAFRKMMVQEGLDPERPEDVRVMLDRIVRHSTNLPSARLQ